MLDFYERRWLYLLFWKSDEADAENKDDATEDGRDDDVSLEIRHQNENLEADPRSDRQNRDCRDQSDVGLSEPVQNVEHHFQRL